MTHVASKTDSGNGPNIRAPRAAQLAPATSAEWRG